MENTKSSENWSRIQAHTLIREFKKYPCLYSPLDINFLNKPVRSEKMNSILNELKTIKPTVTIEEIKKKIKSLKAQLFKERQKVVNSKRSGSGADQVYEPTLWCYDELSFLLNVNDVEPSKSNIDLTEIGIEENSETRSGIIDEDSQQILEDSKITSQKKRKSKGFHPLETCGMEAIEFMKNYFSNHPKKQPPQREEEFCRYLCRLLKKIKLEITFEKLEFEIISLVNQKIDEERKFMETNNYCSPNLRLIPSFTPSSLTTSSSDSSNLPSPSTFQLFDYPQTLPFIADSPTYLDEHINLDIQPASSTSTCNPSKSSTCISSPSTNNQPSSIKYIKCKPVLITSRSQNSHNTYNSPINTPSPPAHPNFINSPIYHSNPIPIRNQPQSQSKPVILEQLLIKEKASHNPKSILDQAMDGVFEDIIIEDSKIIL